MRDADGVQVNQLMNRDQLISLLQAQPQGSVVVEFRYKTGYDEGDIYHVTPNEAVNRDGEIVLSGGWRLVGGW